MLYCGCDCGRLVFGNSKSDAWPFIAERSRVLYLWDGKKAQEKGRLLLWL